MARHRLEITDGTTTVEFNDQNPIEVASFSFGTPDLDEVAVEPQVGRDGGEVFGTAKRNVKDTLVLHIPTTSASARSEINAIENLLRQAGAYQNQHLGEPVYLQVQWESAGDVWRSEVLYGSLRVEEISLYHWAQSHDYFKVTLRITRRFFWEGPETELPLTNGNGADQTGGLTVYAHGDDGPGHDNYVAIDGDDVDGIEKAPARLELTNTYASATRNANVYVAHNVNSDPPNFTHILEGEDSAVGAATTGAGSGYSNGGYLTTPALAASEVELARWDLSTALLNAAGGNFFRLVAAFSGTIPAGVYLRAKVKFALTTLYESEWVQLQASVGAVNPELQDVVSLQLPPYLVGAGDLYPLTLHVYGKSASSTSTLTLDFVQLSPLDGWRELVAKGYGQGQDVRLVDDMLRGYLYTDSWSTAGKAGNYIGEGERIMLEPGSDQRLYFLWDEITGSDYEPMRTMSVKVFYRPRRLTV